MGLWDRITGQAKAQFLDVLQWIDGANDAILHRFPIHDQAITDQSKLVVREGQAAVFLAGGQLSEVFGPGTYTLDTPNSPILSFFQTIGYGMQNPYKGDVLFVSTRQFTDNGWGTQNPFMMRDAEFGPVRVRAFGSYSFRVKDPAVFVRQVVGADGLFTRDEIVGQLKKRVVSAFATSVGKARIPVLDLAAHYDTLGDGVRDAMNPEFETSYGVVLTDFTIGNISLPAEVEEALDQRSKMGVLGNLDQYAKLKAAESIETAAANPGLGGAGVGMGVGFGLGNTVAQQLGTAMSTPSGAGGAPPPVPTARYHYDGPGGRAELDAAGVAQRVAAARDGRHLVWQAGWSGWKPALDVPEIAGQVPPPVQAPPPPPGAAVFHHHGPQGSSQGTAAEVAQRVLAAPDADHHVWQTGWDGWRPARDVPAIAAHLAPPVPEGPPPPPGDDGPPPPPSP